MIDEATGYQYERASDALQIKLKLFLAEEMRKWDKTFPDDLWVQFGRPTNWTGSIHSRPKYWGNLVMELIYEYLDADVAQWLPDNAPKPLKGQNHHQWMSEQYGLKRLIEHIWKVIGLASGCEDMRELKNKMQEIYGKAPGFSTR
jgi:P63C domain-containing protein